MESDMRGRSSSTKVRLEEAMALLIQNQVALTQNHVSFVSQMTEMNRRFDEMRKELNAIKAILYQLPEAIRQKIGFKSE